MAFFQSAVSTLQTLVIALGAGLGIWGAINLMEGYGKLWIPRISDHGMCGNLRSPDSVGSI